MLDKQSSATELLSLVASGDRAAFRILFERTAPRQLAIARRILGRTDLAEDAVQEAYLTIWTKAANYRENLGSADAWITTIVRRRAIDFLRASPWLSREVAESVTNPAQSAITTSTPERLTLEHCLSALEQKVNTAIRLAYVYGFTHSELSQRLDIPLGTLKSRIKRGLASLKECLEA